MSYEKQRTSLGATIVSRFDSVTALVEHVDSADVRKASKAPSVVDGLEVPRQGADWTGLADSAQQTPAFLRQLVREGWADGAARIQQLADQIEVPPVTSVRRRAKWAAEGDSVDMHRVWGGQLDSAWRRTVRQQLRAPQTVTLCADITALAHVDAADLFWRGAAAIALADALSAAGYNVEIVAASVSRETYTDGTNSATFVTIKPATVPVERNTLAAALALAYFNRGLIFVHRALCPLAAAKSGLGRSTTARSAGLLPAGALDGLDAVKSLATAQRWIAEAVARLQAPAEAAA